MPKAEIGSTKYLNNKLKSKGLQRLRWYCQVCERQMRDENGFKMHTQSESHVRQMLLVGEDPRKYINDYSNQFQRDFLQLLRTSHGEKKVNLNHFYQEYISNKEHIHMNATKFQSLTEYAKYLGREGICRVEEDEKGLQVAWIDNSPENLRRQDAIRKKDRQDKGDEEREQNLIREQVRRAQQDSEARGDVEEDEATKELKRGQGETIRLKISHKLAAPRTSPPAQISTLAEESSKKKSSGGAGETTIEREEIEESMESVPENFAATSSSNPVPEKVAMKMGISSKPKNVFAAAKKNALGGKKAVVIEQPKKISEAERIMREEIERKGKRGPSGSEGPWTKKPRY